MATERPLRLCQIVAPGAFGGLESVVTSLASGLARRGHEVQVFALLDPAGQSPPFDALPVAGVPVTEIRLPPRSYRAEIRRLTRELEQVPGAIAHTHGYHADLVGVRAARAAARQIVSTVHGFAGGGWKNRLYEWFDRRALVGFDAVVPVSRPLAQLLQRAGTPAGHLHVIPNAYDDRRELLGRAEARRLLGLPMDLPVVGWVGRLSHEKGPDVFLQALAAAPEWHGSIVGSGPLEAELREYVTASGFGARVRWHGTVAGAGGLLGAFDALAMTSRTEGTPIVLLEAMATGVPLIATEVGGIPDMVGPAEAILVPSEAPGRVARALEGIRSEPGSAAARAAAAKDRLARSYSLEPWLERYEAVYRGLAG